MASLPPFLVVLDISALLAGSRREWQEFTRIGHCFLPEAALAELRSLCDRAVESSQEQTAREFFRFFPESGWRTTPLLESHPSLQPAEGHTLSKKARLAQSVAQAAYGMARHRSDGLVVLVSNDMSLMQKVRLLGVQNLCAIPLTAMVQWSRTERKPPVVTHQLQAMRSPAVATASTTANKATRTSSPTRTVASTPRPVTPQRSTQKPFRIPVSKIFFNLLTLGIVAIAVLAVWRVVHPSSFTQFWRLLPLPSQSFSPKNSSIENS